MANYNIEMQYYNGSSYDVLYPNIPLSNVNDWEDNVYSKTEIDSTISSINNSINNISLSWDLYLTFDLYGINQSTNSLSISFSDLFCFYIYFSGVRVQEINGNSTFIRMLINGEYIGYSIGSYSTSTDDILGPVCFVNGRNIISYCRRAEPGSSNATFIYRDNILPSTDYKNLTISATTSDVFYSGTMFVYGATLT